MKHAFKRLTQSGVLRLAVKAGLTIVAFWYVFRGVDFVHLHEMLQKQAHIMIYAAALFMVIQPIVGAFRWRLILNSLVHAGEHGISVMASLKICFIGGFFMTCLPGAVGGNVVRVWLAKQEHVPLPLAISSVIIDRMIALAALVLIVLVTLPMLGIATGFETMLVYPLAITAIVAGLWLLFNIDRLLQPFRHLRFIHWILHFAGSLRLLLTHPVAAVVSLGFAVITHISYCLSAYILAQSLSIDITILQCITLIPPVILATTLPISIGGWGIREAGIVGMLGLVGISPASALMLSIQLGLLNIFLNLPASLLWLAYRRHSSHRLPMDNSTAIGVGR